MATTVTIRIETIVMVSVSGHTAAVLRVLHLYSVVLKMDHYVERVTGN